MKITRQQLRKHIREATEEESYDQDQAIKILDMLASPDITYYNQALELIAMSGGIPGLNELSADWLRKSEQYRLHSRLIREFLTNVNPGSESDSALWNIATQVLADYRVTMEYARFKSSGMVQKTLFIPMIKQLIDEGSAGDGLKYLQGLFLYYVLNGGINAQGLAAAIYAYGIDGEIPDWLIEE